MIQAITILTLSVLVFILFTRLERQENKIQALSEAMKIVDDLLGRLQESSGVHAKAIGTLDDLFDAHGERQDEFDRRLTDLAKKLEKVDDLIDAHTEMEKEAAKLEREWQEGLNNLLNYEVMK